MVSAWLNEIVLSLLHTMDICQCWLLLKVANVRSSVKASPDGAVAKSSDSGMAGTGFAYRYRIQP